jgi:hypothetical protein
MTMYRFAQVFAFLGVVLWLIRVAVDLYQVMVHQKQNRAQASSSRWTPKGVSSKLRQTSTTDQTSMPRLFSH